MELNLLLLGQSNALFFDYFGGYQSVQADVERLLGFDGVTNTIDLLGGETPDAAGYVTAVAGTPLLPPNPDSWLNTVNGDYTQGFTPNTNEQNMLDYIADLPEDERAAPTAVIFMHDETDSTQTSETTAEWTAAVQDDAGLVREAFGQTAATVPFLFVPIPFDQGDPTTMQAIRRGEEELAADPTFNGDVATHTGDLNMNNPVNGLPAGSPAIYGGPHITAEDAQILAARIAVSVADEFAQYALPSSPIALAGGHVDDSGPQAVRVDWRAAQPTQVIVSLENDPSAPGLEPLGTEAAAGLGWTIRDGSSSIAATAAVELPGDQLLLTFAETVPTDAAALLFYSYGTGRVAVGAATHTDAGYPGTGLGYPGEGNGIYDSDGLPVWSSAAGIAIDSTAVATSVVPCYCTGARIKTEHGDVSVEALAVGDIVITASGQHRPIRWIGRRSYAGRFLAANPNVHPIRFRVGSLGDGLPHRDLLVSPEHAMFIDGLLIPARCLVNGATIVQESRLGRVDYFHVELDSHDVLLAEGTPSESYLDDDSRSMFHNVHKFAGLYPDAPKPGHFCAPKVDDGYVLEAIRRRLA